MTAGRSCDMSRAPLHVAQESSTERGLGPPTTRCLGTPRHDRTQAEGRVDGDVV
jgi:hypothetical protein